MHVDNNNNGINVAFIKNKGPVKDCGQMVGSFGFHVGDQHSIHPMDILVFVGNDRVIFLLQC